VVNVHDVDQSEAELLAIHKENVENSEPPAPKKKSK